MGIKYNHENILGSKFGRLTILEIDKEKISNYRSKKTGYRIYYKCSCDCGKIISVRKCALLAKKNSSKSCGCLQLEKARLSKKRLSFGEAPKRALYRIYKYGAARRKLDFTLLYEDFVKLISSKCHYCDCDPVSKYNLPYDKNKIDCLQYNGVDRLDNKVGYKPENCVTCCRYCNSFKSDLDLEQMKQKIINIHKNLENNKF